MGSRCWTEWRKLPLVRLLHLMVTGPDMAETALEWVAMHCAGAADKPVQEIKLNKVSIQANPIAR